LDSQRTTAAFTMGAEYVVAGKTRRRPILGSVALMVLGALVAGLRDLRFDAWGYLLVFASNASTALYLSMISRYGSRSSLNSFGASSQRRSLPSCARPLLSLSLSPHPAQSGRRQAPPVR
jgi:drug/metabolite transporter (DMT)-like permease